MEHKKFLSEIGRVGGSRKTIAKKKAGIVNSAKAREVYMAGIKAKKRIAGL